MRARALAALGVAAAVAGSMALVATPASAESLTLRARCDRTARASH
jgi:hypothetical protein